MGYLNQMEADEYFLDAVSEEINEIVDETEDRDCLMEAWTAEEILEYRDRGSSSWQIAQIICDTED